AAARAVQRAAGFDEAFAVSPGEVLRLTPALPRDCALGGSFCPADGCRVPLAVMRGSHEGARRLGVRFRFGEPCTVLRLEGECIAAVATSHGEIATRCVVNAAGAWASQIGRYAGVDVPVVPLRRQVALTEPCDLLP